MAINKNKIKYIVLYSLIIGWVLAFIYDNTLIKSVIVTAEDTDILFLGLFVASIIGCLIFTFIKSLRKKLSNRPFLLISIASSCLIYFLPQISLGIQLGLFGLIALSMTIASLNYISQLRHHIELKESFIAAGIVMLIANVMSVTSNLLISSLSRDAAFIFINICLLAPVVVEVKEDSVCSLNTNFKIVNSELIKIFILIYLLKISEGVLYSNVPNYYQASTFAYFYVLPYLLAIAIIILILRSSRFNVMSQLIAFSICFIGIGSMLPMLNNGMLNSVMIHFSYGFLDVIIWGILISFCFVYSNFIIGISLIMASHMMGILTGGLISDVVNPHNTIMIVLVCAFIAVLFLPGLNKFMFSDILNKQLEIDKYNRLVEKIRKKDNYNILTNREKEVLELIILKKKYAEVAQELHITETTVKTHIKHIFSKIGVKNKKELIEVFVEK